MPFTPSHIAAVLPLVSSERVRRVLDPWALALGTMVPDLPIFLPFLPDYSIWHSAKGVLVLAPPAVVLLMVLFHGFLRDPLTTLLPPSLVGRAAALAPRRYGLRHLPGVLAGGVLGAFTHMAWDSFTHSYSSAIWGWAWLDARLAGTIQVFRVFQYVSTVVGLAAVLWWAWRGLTRMEPRPVPGRLAVSGRARFGALSATAVSTLLGAATWPLVFPPDSRAAMATRLGAGVVVGCFLGLFAYALVWRLRQVMAVFERA
ncbi:DUF4184 family protein [Planomonospora venezuelensis]|uniref:DUF4184 family protein n=1 Tax=Planomonospora venezuelensis TaxID=1999 RepID=A0A841CY40_PLAVE|nr:hypothetical protein [Planomonospora venezuelensis]GIN00720.1 hypothetical protein Pve01_23780 [Planomonospora venezuelensis]